MTSIPIVTLLLYDLFVLGSAVGRVRDSSKKWETLLVSGLFFCSGMPALIYQIVWQRVLFSIYGVNA